ncbi:hypothetical protein CEUSTIGMA_g8246.t1 [Chlamydomonas eustigma]|uniref:DNA/RNA-binding protein Alba-like domain-containing protein n=1 Tax=Chlamydomonas eustigma TaxID=1157962 RepID=A0A250XDH0_9CHLO|nr:hypothetical protein CEUSTIGMA_g8246.t1 [Chlamydomonas eustigma]|eukprot:GAX80810.1 hypothetical protein CEUSTIGMA_g8246.t1 [Chlamydomonas eustigma]
MLIKALSNVASTVHAATPFLLHVRSLSGGVALRSNYEQASADPSKCFVGYKDFNLWRYLRISNTILSEHGRISFLGTGKAVCNALALSEVLKRDGLAVEKELKVSLKQDGTTEAEASAEVVKMSPTVQILVTLEKSPKFEELREMCDNEYVRMGKLEFEERERRRSQRSLETKA